MNTVYKWIPYDYWQNTEYENWLKEQAASGLEIQHTGKYRDDVILEEVVRKIIL